MREAAKVTLVHPRIIIQIERQAISFSVRVGDRLLWVSSILVLRGPRRPIPVVANRTPKLSGASFRKIRLPVQNSKGLAGM